MTLVARMFPVLAGLAARTRVAAARLERVRPRYVVGGFVVVQWLATLAFALTVRHNGWLFYHGGDQVWFYTTSWFLRHGLLIPTNVGFGWSTLLMPFALFGGPDLTLAIPGIVLLNVFFLMPVAMVAMYGIGHRLGGRLFGYWVLFLWVVLPYIGIKYTDAGFKSRYTELSLPDSLGLTSLSDFPHMVMLAVAAYFLLRAVQGRLRWDGAFAGLFAGAAIGMKPSSALFLGGAVLALVGCRCWRLIPAFTLGLAPSIAALTYWKWHGLGYLPIFHAEESARLAIGSGTPFAATVSLSKYLPFHWHQFSQNLGSLQEHFWSRRVFEWIVIAGTLALLRRSLPALLLFGGWFWAFVLVKGSSTLGLLETGGLLHMLIPAIPAFVVMIACLPLLLPGAQRHLRPVPPPRPWGPPGLRTSLLIAGVLLFAVVPVALSAAATPTVNFAYTQSGPVPMVDDLHLTATPLPRGYMRLRWTKPHPAGVPIFFEILRSSGSNCTGSPFIVACATVLDTTRSDVYTDRVVVGYYNYHIALGANWIDDPKAGDVYLISNPVIVKSLR